MEHYECQFCGEEHLTQRLPRAFLLVHCKRCGISIEYLLRGQENPTLRTSFRTYEYLENFYEDVPLPEDILEEARVLEETRRRREDRREAIENLNRARQLMEEASEELQRLNEAP